MQSCKMTLVNSREIRQYLKKAKNITDIQQDVAIKADIADMERFQD